MASEASSPGMAARTLATIADVLAAKAGVKGGLRSGPAGNVSWKKAFNYLEVSSDRTANHPDFVSQEIPDLENWE